MLKMEKNAHEETKQKLSEIERKLKDSEKQVAELQRQLAILKEELILVNARNKELASQTLMLREDPIILPAVQLTQALETERRLKEHEIRINELKKQLGNETSKRQVAEQRNREIEKQLKDKPQVLQQKLSNASTEEKKAKDMLKMEKNAHEETKQELSEIERKLKDSEKQVAELQRQLAILKEELTLVNARNKELASQTLMLREDPIILPAVQLTQMPDDLLAFIKENKDKLIVIHVYSHARVKIVDVEKIKGRIVEKLSHAVFLDADLEDTEVMEFFCSWKQPAKQRFVNVVMLFIPL
ncbi:unnamed protein product [Darwinula stevensoni]|uniref:Uncharacterized protein n=1 Tax=Darwinula stevensoni TaxID=69355 RepID=A0A7R9FQW7_9CRUS|nr:unnamed protein product [Darwinula stevensoni]CAG0900544.1 unnamed protein product [Darwinula stevensoni]